MIDLDEERLVVVVAELYQAAVTMYGLTTNLRLLPDDLSDVETGRRQLLAALRVAGFGDADTVGKAIEREGIR